MPLTAATGTAGSREGAGGWNACPFGLMGTCGALCVLTTTGAAATCGAGTNRADGVGADERVTLFAGEVLGTQTPP